MHVGTQNWWKTGCPKGELQLSFLIQSLGPIPLVKTRASVNLIFVSNIYQRNNFQCAIKFFLIIYEGSLGVP